MRNATIVLVFAVLVLYATATWMAWRRPVSPGDLEPVDTGYRLALNCADVDALTLLPGVGPSTAARIVEYRRQHGPFTNTNQLLKVPGIGPAKHAGVSKLVHIGAIDGATGPAPAQPN